MFLLCNVKNHVVKSDRPFPGSAGIFAALQVSQVGFFLSRLSHQLMRSSFSHTPASILFGLHKKSQLSVLFIPPSIEIRTSLSSSLDSVRSFQKGADSQAPQYYFSLHNVFFIISFSDGFPFTFSNPRVHDPLFCDIFINIYIE